MGTTNGIYSVIPEEEKKCVWMVAGVVSYKLCERDFDCEHCPFDLGIKSTESREDGIDWSGLSTTDAVVDPLFYHREHCWVKVENSEMVWIGIDDLIANLMIDERVIILPQINTYVRKEDCFAYIIQRNYIMPVISPLSGLVLTVNQCVKDVPSLLSHDPKGEGWLITLKPENLTYELKDFLYGKRAFLWRKKRERELMVLISSLLEKNYPELGVTMQDGGKRVSSLKEVLSLTSPEQRILILDLFLNSSVNQKKKPLSKNNFPEDN